MMLDRKPPILPGRFCTKLTTLLTKVLPALLALLPMLETQEPTFEMTLLRKLAMFCGRFWKKFTTPSTNPEPACAALSARLETHPPTVSITLWRKLPIFSGRLWKNSSMELIAFGTSCVKKVLIPSTTPPMNSTIAFQISVTALRKSSLVVHKVTMAAITPAMMPMTSPTGEDSCTALRILWATVRPSVAVFHDLKAVTIASIFCATMIPPSAVAMPVISGPIVGRLSFSHEMPSFIGGITLDTASLMPLMNPVTFSLPMAS